MPSAVISSIASSAMTSATPRSLPRRAACSTAIDESQFGHRSLSVPGSCCAATRRSGLPGPARSARRRSTAAVAEEHAGRPPQDLVGHLHAQGDPHLPHAQQVGVELVRHVVAVRCWSADGHHGPSVSMLPSAAPARRAACPASGSAAAATCRPGRAVDWKTQFSPAPHGVLVVVDADCRRLRTVGRPRTCRIGRPAGPAAAAADRRRTRCGSRRRCRRPAGRSGSRRSGAAGKVLVAGTSFEVVGVRLDLRDPGAGVVLLS